MFRADAALAMPEIYEALEERGVKCAVRIPANDSLERDIAELLTRPVGRPSHKPVVMTRLSCHRFRSDEVRLWLSLIACNLGNLSRRLVLPRWIENWSLTSLQHRLVKAGGRLIKHVRCYSLLLAEGHLTRWLFGSMVRRIDPLAVASRQGEAIGTAKSGDHGGEGGRGVCGRR